MENILAPVAVGSLLQQEDGQAKFKFFIPSYQRGYRWDKEQVEDLLDDLFEFITTSKSKEEKYCLQPIVIKRLESGKFEVLDGQQRLTTIFILLSRLKKNNSEIDLFSLEYETRPDSATFLERIDTVVNSENPDYYYISNAYITIHDWLKKTKNKKANISTSLFDAIAESIEFIWYEIKKDIDAIDVFTRINIGKIPLTNSELVKAVFLSKNNLSLGYANSETEEKDFSKILSLKQNAIALEWDQMEKTMQDPKVWAFMYAGADDYDTRIDYLLDLRSNKAATSKNKYHSFKYFYDKVRDVRGDKPKLSDFAKGGYTFIESEWNELKGFFDILLEWYHDKTYNHLIGFLISQQIKIADLIIEFQQNDRTAFLNEIKQKINRLIKTDDVGSLRYNVDNKLIERILLLHNVVNSLSIMDNNVYFPFDRMKNKSWTLEHIFAQNSDTLKEEDFKNWLEDHLLYLRPKAENQKVDSIILSIEKILNSGGKTIDKEDFQECFSNVASFIQNEIQSIDALELPKQVAAESDMDEGGIDKEAYSWINDDHSIANLALLDGGINSSIKNSIFEIKRRLIIEKDRQGLFIPLETKKVFLKYYTSAPNHLAYWTFMDRQAYVESIKLSLNYLN
jgi:hypothetical protein